MKTKKHCNDKKKMAGGDVFNIVTFLLFHLLITFNTYEIKSKQAMYFDIKTFSIIHYPCSYPSGQL